MKLFFCLLSYLKASSDSRAAERLLSLGLRKSPFHTSDFSTWNNIRNLLTRDSFIPISVTAQVSLDYGIHISDLEQVVRIHKASRNLCSPLRVGKFLHDCFLHH